MPRDGSGNFTLPANTQAVSGDPISSTKFNTLVQDLEADANVDRPIAAGGTGASTALAARANLGLVIGTDVQAYDAGLLSIAGLTTLADRSIYTTASDTYAVYTLTAAGRAILDDADAAAQRTTLGLAIGTDVQAFDQQLLDIAALAVTDSGFIVGNGTTFVLETGATAQTSLGYTAADVLTKLLTVDGAGSSLDADLLDGVQGSAYATLAGANTFTARQIVDRTAAAGAGNLTIRGAGTGFVRSSLTLETADTTRGAGVYIWDDTSDVEFFFGLRFNHVSGDALSILRRTSVTSGSTDSATADPATATEIARFASTGMVARVLAGTETTGTLTVASANRTIQATGDITVPNAVFAAGDIILIYAGASSRTITQGASVTMRLGGTATTGSRTLAARGVAVLFFVSSSEVVVSGGAVT
jgi:hypothetical protein